jgi:hypothetical protein
MCRAAAETFVSRKIFRNRARAAIAIAMLAAYPLAAQTTASAPSSAPAAALPPFILRAQTVRIPLNAFRLDNTHPVANLSASSFRLSIDGKPRSFTLSRAGANAVDPKTGKPEDRPNMLIILPYANPQYRSDVLDDAIRDLGREPDLGWNISILDDGGDQTPYTTDKKTVLSELVQIKNENPAATDLTTWRRTASLAIASMRVLPGRRIVMTLGDIFHEVVYDNALQPVYENFEAHDVAAAARDAGAVIYAAESFQEIGPLRGLFPYYYVQGFGPWMLLTRDNHLEGWISNFVSDTITEIQQDSVGAYEITLHLDAKEMDGRPHSVAVKPTVQGILLNVPQYYVAPDLRQLQELAMASPALRHALATFPKQGDSPLQVATRLSYFPHPDGRTGTQIATTGLFWTQTTDPPKSLQVGLQLQQTNTGLMVNTSVGQLNWSVAQPEFNTSVDLVPGAYLLRVAAADTSGKIATAADSQFTVDPSNGEQLLISSLVLGKSCRFTPTTQGKSAHVDYLRAGNCQILPDPSHYYSIEDVAWTLVRITPVGKLVKKLPKSWKGSFLLVDEKGTTISEQPLHWLQASDGALVATAAFPLNDTQSILTNGEYAVMLKLKGPGVPANYVEDAPFLIYDAAPAPPDAKR